MPKFILMICLPALKTPGVPTLYSVNDNQVSQSSQQLSQILSNISIQLPNVVLLVRPLVQFASPHQASLRCVVTTRLVVVVRKVFFILAKLPNTFRLTVTEHSLMQRNHVWAKVPRVGASEDSTVLLVGAGDNEVSVDVCQRFLPLSLCHDICHVSLILLSLSHIFFSPILRIDGPFMALSPPL